MSDAIAAANIITNAMFMKDMGDTLAAIQARRDYQGEIAHLRAWLQHYERQQAVLASAATEAIRIAKDYELTIARLERENQQLRNQNAELSAGKKAAEDRAQAEGRRLVHWELYGAPPPNDPR